jgi:hypothetical protein
MAQTINHKDLAISRLAVQFRESVKLINYIRALLLEADNLESVIQSIIDERWIDTAIGAQLDIIGEIVGQPRSIANFSLFLFFGFKVAGDPDPVDRLGFGSVKDSGLGARFISVTEDPFGSNVLDDETYRIVIKGRIMKNSNIPTINNLIESINFVLDNPQPNITELPNAEYTVAFGVPLNSLDIALIDDGLLPKPAGIKVNYTYS